jgi:acetyltransferase-like isoleucine patch superfamily enzyme
MKNFFEFLRTVHFTIQLIFEMLRAAVLRIRGADLASKVRIGNNFNVDLAPNLKLGKRVLVESEVYFKIVRCSARLTINEYSFVGKGVVIDVSRNIEIGSHTLIAPGSFITDHNHGTSGSLRIDQQECIESDVHIGNDVWIGANSVILAGVTIGNGAVIGAGAVVIRDVGEMDIVAGVPARKIGSRKVDPSTSEPR